MLRYQLSLKVLQHTLLAKLSRNGHSCTHSINRHSPYGRQFDNSVGIAKAFRLTCQCHLGNLSPLSEICEVADATLQRQSVRCTAYWGSIVRNSKWLEEKSIIHPKTSLWKINLYKNKPQLRDILQLLLKTVKANKTKGSLRSCHSWEEPMETWWLMLTSAPGAENGKTTAIRTRHKL